MNIKQLADNFVMNTYSRFPLTFVDAKGVCLYDENGKEYLDFTSGIAVNALGYGNEKVLNAAQEQMGKFFHTSNLYYTEPMAKLAQKLVEKTCFDKVFYANSGAEANEAAFKLARKYGYLNKNGASKIISMKNSFHGRTLATVTLTGQEKYQKGFSPLVENILYATFNDIESVKEIISDDVCAIFVEPIQGEGGLLPAEPEFLKGLRQICDENNILLIFDEVQTGVGRTGKLYCYQNYGVEPDILTSAKALGCGMPIGAMLAKDFVAKAFEPGNHASTFGGNPVACACANALLDEFDEKDILLNVNEVGTYLIEQLKTINSPKIKAVRGLGLMVGIELDTEVKEIVLNCMERGLLVINAGANVIRFVPPLVITKADVDKAISILKGVI